MRPVRERRRRDSAGLPPPARSRSARIIFAWLSFLIVSFAVHRASAFAQTPLQSQTQAQTPPSVSQSPVLELPRKASRRPVDRELTGKITEFLHSHRLSSVRAQVFIDKKGSRTVVLTGQLAYEAIKEQAEQQVRDFLRDAPIAIQNRIRVGPGPASTPPPIVGNQNELEIPQIGRLSTRFLGCWHGITAETPLGWHALSPTASYLGYHSDRIGLCVTLQDGELHVTDASAKGAGPRYTRGGGLDYGFSYKPLKASGTQILLDLKSWDPTMPDYVVNGSARCTLNADDTVTYFISATTSINGQAAVRSETVAQLERDR